MASLRGAEAHLVLKLLGFILFGILLFSVMNAFYSDELEVRANLGSARQAVFSRGTSWGTEIVTTQAQYSQWLVRHGTVFEQRLFDDYSAFLLRASARFSGEMDSMFFFQRISLSLHFGLLRILFVIVACYRIWLLAIGIAFVLAYFKIRPKWRDDVLGQTGNGRIFYSGVTANLDEVDERGRPVGQVVGLACPRRCSDTEAKQSGICRVLERYQALNGTNLHLCAILEAHREYPAYVAERGEEALLEDSYRGTNLSDNAQALLQAAFSLVKRYHDAPYSKDELMLSGELEALNGDTTVGEEDNDSQSSQVDSSRYAELVREAFHRVLSPIMRRVLADISYAELATLILSHEAGKVLVYASEGGQWFRKSNFGQLCARAVLHSIPAYSRDYQGLARDDIRRGLVYGSRRSVFAAVRFPVDMSERSWAMRQWVELLMASPHQLQVVADEVELIGVLEESHKAWGRVFFEGVISRSPEVVEGSYASINNLLFMPLASVLNLFRQVVSFDNLARLHTLVSLVSQKQRLETISQDLQDSTGADREKAARPQDKLLTPLSYLEVKQLSDRFKISVEDLNDWSALRVVLNAYGWLARRVGDYTVPDSSVIYAVFDAGIGAREANSMGLIGKTGMVAFRASKLVTRMGRTWSQPFIQVGQANMAENEDGFQLLLKGVEPVTEEVESM